MTKRLFTGGDWPTWLVATGASLAFAAGLFASWAVFAESTPVAPPKAIGGSSELTERVKAMEQENEELNKRILALEKANEQAKSVIETNLVSAQMLRLADATGRCRVGIGTIRGETFIEVLRADRSVASKLTEKDGEVAFALYDTSNRLRVDLDILRDGTSRVRVLDDQQQPQPRLGLICLPGGQASFLNVDKFGIPTVVE